MARKKSVDPVNESVQDVNTPQEEMVPAGDMSSEDSAALYGQDMAEDWDGTASPADTPTDQHDPESAPELIEGDASLMPAEFPAEDGPPFEGDPMENTSSENGIAADRSEAGNASDEQDYGELLQEVDSATPIEAEPDETDAEDSPLPMPEGDIAVASPRPFPTGQAAATGGTPRSRLASGQRSSQVLTIDARDHVQTDQEREEIIWHEVRNAYRTRRILTGTLGGLERTPSGKTLAVVDYKGFRVAILLQEMLFLPKRMPANSDYQAFMDRQHRNLNNMLGAEIDFIVRGIDSNTRSIVASRKDAMLKKRQTFYMNTDELGGHMIYEGRVVQARVIAVAEKVIRVEAFGVECPIIARDLSWEWLGDAREHFCVGDRVLIRVLMELRFSFLGQVGLPDNAFARLGVESFPTKLQLWQKKSEVKGWTARRYTTGLAKTLSDWFDPTAEAQSIYEQMLMLPKADLEKNKSHVLLELAREYNASKDFTYQAQKLLYQIKAHPATRDSYARCCEYLHRFYTQKMPPNMDYKEWQKVKLTEPKVLSYLRRTLRKQNKKPERDVVALVKQNDSFVYKAYSAKARGTLTGDMKVPVPIYQAVLDDEPEQYPGFERLLRRKRREYDNQSQPFADMVEDPAIGAWLKEFALWDAENEEYIRLNDVQRRDINMMLQKRYGMLQWEQGSGKTLAAIAMGLYRMEHQGIHSTWVVSSAISIRNNWDVVLPNYGLSHVFVEELKDLARIKPGDFVLLTLNKLGLLQKRIKRWVKQHNQKIMLVLDESDEITNPYSKRAKSTLSCFRRCRSKLLTTGTSTRNNISEFAPQLELLYNNSVNMVSWCHRVYSYDKDFDRINSTSNRYYGCPIPAYKRGYSLFSASHLPEKPTVFGIGERTQDIYNADDLNDILAKTVITRTFEEVTGKEIRRIHQVPLPLMGAEKDVYNVVIKEFNRIQWEYFASTGNSRKDAMLRLMQQITLMLRVAAAPNTVKEYVGDTPLKIIAAVEMAAQWEDEIVAIGVRHQNILDAYAQAIRELLPERPLFTVTGSTKTFAQRRALRKTLRESGNGILLCTQQSLPSSVNFEYVNKILIPEMHYNNSGMSQFYMRFIRYTSTEFKDIYFLNYIGSLESNLLQMVMAKEKINLFMKGKDADLDEIHEKFGVDYDLLALLMQKGEDKDGRFEIRWGEQMIA